MKQTTNTKKLALAGVLTALAIVGSFLSFPVAGSKCAPVQHMVNIFTSWSRLGRWNCLLCKSSTQHTWNRKPDGLSWKYDRSALLWTYLQEM